MISITKKKETKSILKSKRCAYSKGEIKGTINVKEPCDNLLSFLLSSGDIPLSLFHNNNNNNNNDRDEEIFKMDISGDMEMEEEEEGMKKERMNLREYLESNYGGNTKYKYQMPHENMEVFCVVA